MINDTHPKIRQLYNKRLLSKSPLERLRMASGMYDSAKALATSGIINEKEKLDSAQLRRELFLRMYKNDFLDIDIERIMKKIPNMR